MVIGDAVGLPVQFKPREVFKDNPVTDMEEKGTFNKPKGFWSDDSSMTLCTMDSLCKGYNLNDIADTFLEWLDNGKWTPDGNTYDVGQTTTRALLNYRRNKGNPAVGLTSPRRRERWSLYSMV